MRRAIAAAVAVTALAGPVAAQTLGSGAPVELPWLRLFLALIVCLMLAAGAALVLRLRLRRGGAPAPPGGPLAPLLRNLLSARGAGRLKLVETVWLGQTSLSILECDGREFLFGQTAQGRIFLRPLADLDRLDVE